MIVVEQYLYNLLSMLYGRFVLLYLQTKRKNKMKTLSLHNPIYCFYKYFKEFHSTYYFLFKLKYIYLFNPSLKTVMGE